MAVTITDATYPTGPETGPDGTPTSHSTGTPLSRPVETAPGKLAGGAGSDKATLDDLAKDSDQVIKLGAGDDYFIFGVGDDTKSDINGIIDMGADFDTVYLTHSIFDYIFTERSDGSIKIQYVGDDPQFDGAAVTFKNAESFVFRNIDPDTGANLENKTYDHDALIALIQLGTPV
jgi:hypothetical protein